MEQKEILQIEKLSAEILLDRLTQIEKKLEEMYQAQKHLPSDQIDLLTRKEVAGLLQVTVQTLHAWNEKGILKSIRIGNRVRYRRKDVDAFLNLDKKSTINLGKLA